MNGLFQMVSFTCWDNGKLSTEVMEVAVMYDRPFGAGSHTSKIIRLESKIHKASCMLWTDTLSFMLYSMGETK